MTSTESTDWKHNPLIVGLLVLFCFPVGLYLLWVHPTWQARTKWIVTGVFAVVMLIGGLSSERDKRAKSQPVVASPQKPLAPSVESTSPISPAVANDPKPLSLTPAPDVSTPEPPVQPFDTTPILTVVKFPGDYVGKRFLRKFWIASFKIQKGSDGTWRMITLDGNVPKDSASSLGEFYLHESDLNFLLTPDQAKQVSSFPDGFSHKCNVTFTIEKRRIGSKEYFVTVISEIYRIGQ